MSVSDDTEHCAGQGKNTEYPELFESEIFDYRESLILQNNSVK